MSHVRSRPWVVSGGRVTGAAAARQVELNARREAGRAAQLAAAEAKRARRGAAS